MLRAVDYSDLCSFYCTAIRYQGNVLSIQQGLVQLQCNLQIPTYKRKNLNRNYPNQIVCVYPSSTGSIYFSRMKLLCAIYQLDLGKLTAWPESPSNLSMS
jgi:hypothetical protein